MTVLYSLALAQICLTVGTPDIVPCVLYIAAGVDAFNRIVEHFGGWDF